MFSNPDFRRAMSMAVDRDAMVKGPFYGYGFKTWSLITSGNARWYDSTIAEVWFKTAEDAEAAGFVKAGSRASKAANEEADQ